LQNGWVKLHRKITENIFLMKDNNAYMVFTKLLILANSKGQVGLSSRNLAETVNLSHGTLYKTLKRLEGETLIEQSSKHSYTLISICKWADYQETGKQYGKQMVNAGETHGKRLTGVARIEKENKERGIIFEEEKDSRASRETAERIRQQLKERGIVK